MNNDNEIYPQITPRKKVSLAKPPAERSQLVSGTFGSVAGGRSGRRISLEKKPGDGIYINPNPVQEINFPASPMPAVNAAQIPAARNNIATAVGATPSDPELIAAREGSNIQIRRGHFRCAYDLEFVWLLATAIPALALLGVFAFSVTGDITRLFDNIYNAICIGGIVLSCAFSAICYGKNYGFIAEQDAFVISRRGKTRRYYYADITDVRFEEFSLFGKKRGYIVTIETRYVSDTYRFIFGQNRIFTDATNTPFYYLMRNARLTNAPQNSIPDPDRFMRRSYDPDEY